jgi:bidirectional [NiFe] hydrogenase diaphorase subunit
MEAIVSQQRFAPPSDDRRWRVVETTMRRHGYEANSLIETLHVVQASFGYLEEEALRFVALSLGVPLSRAYGVATFYHHFTLKPQGRHTCVVCAGTACYIKGSSQLLAELERKVGLKPGQTTPAFEVSLLTARCLGSCSLAPTCVFDGEVVGRVSADDLRARVQAWLQPEALEGRVA